LNNRATASAEADPTETFSSVMDGPPHYERLHC